MHYLGCPVCGSPECVCDLEREQEREQGEDDVCLNGDGCDHPYCPVHGEDADPWDCLKSEIQEGEGDA